MYSCVRANYMAFVQQSQGEQVDPKKARRSERQPSPPDSTNSRLRQGPLPSPRTHQDSNATDDFKEGTATPPSQLPGDPTRQVRSPRGQTGLSSPPSDTQPFSQFSYPPHNRSYAVDDEEGEGVWGYLVPLDYRSGEPLVLRRRTACPVPQSKVGRTSGKERVSSKEYERQEEEYETEKVNHGVTAGGYLIGRHPECGRLIPAICR
jgi:serine/threonine-protein kinase Chk2